MLLPSGTGAVLSYAAAVACLFVAPIVALVLCSLFQRYQVLLGLGTALLALAGVFLLRTHLVHGHNFRDADASAIVIAPITVTGLILLVGALIRWVQSRDGDAGRGAPGR
jgi:hypothetical protein